MPPKEIVVVLPSWWRDPVDEAEDGRPISQREFDQIDAFAAAISEHSESPVRVVDIAALDRTLDGDDGAGGGGGPGSGGGGPGGRGGDGPGGDVDDGIFLAEEQLVADIGARIGVAAPDLYPRVFLLDVERAPRSTRRVEAVGAVGAIECHAYFLWRTERDDAPGRVLGRKDVARRMGATWLESATFETEHYGFVVHDDHPTLPAMLAAYLDAYTPPDPTRSS